jgi:FkbM family methyltransferase
MQNAALLRHIRRTHAQSLGKTIEGQKFYGDVDEFLFNRYFEKALDTVSSGKPTARVFRCLECGANDGFIGSNSKFFEETLGWECYNVEATPAQFEKLQQNRPNSKNFLFALSDRNGEIMFETGQNSFLNKISDKGNISVPAITYRDFVKNNNIKFLDLFILDVEGHEPQVIEGMKNCDVLPEIFCIEDGQSNEVKKLMREMGYTLDASTACNAVYTRELKN